MPVWIDLNKFSSFSSPAMRHYRTLIAFKWAQSHDSIFSALTWALLKLRFPGLTCDRLTGLLKSCQLQASIFHLRIPRADSVTAAQPTCTVMLSHQPTFHGPTHDCLSRGLTKALHSISPYGIRGTSPASLLITLLWILPCLFSWEHDCITLCPQLIRLYIHMLMISFIQPLCHSHLSFNDFHKSVFQQSERRWAINRATFLAHHKESVEKCVLQAAYHCQHKHSFSFGGVFFTENSKDAKLRKILFDCDNLESETIQIPQPHS